MEYTNDQIIDKIKKLLALANRAGTEEEAAAASGKVQELLAQYNLEMAQIDATPDFSKSTTSESRRTKETYSRSAMFAWQRQLWEAIAHANYCWYEATPVWKTNTLGIQLKSNYHHYLIGREANVIATRLMGDYLEDTISRLCPYKPGRDSSKSWNSWKEGCAARLSERLRQKRFEMEEQSRRASEQAASSGGTGMALMTLTDMAQTEDDLNYREKYGEAAYQSRLRSRHNWRVCNCDYCQRTRKSQEEWEKRQSQEVVVPKTEAEKRREEKENEKWQRRWERQRRAEEAKSQRAWAKKDITAYCEGAEAANDIGLDSQVKDGKKGQIG